MHQKVKLGAFMAVFAAACSSAPVEEQRETVGTEATAIRDPLSTMCYYI